MPLSDWELWACAQQVVQQHGTRAAEHIEKRVTALAEAGDEEGLRTWLAIAGRVDELEDVEGRGRARH